MTLQKTKTYARVELCFDALEDLLPLEDLQNFKKYPIFLHLKHVALREGY